MLHTCSACGCLSRPSESACPHCGAALNLRRPRSAAALLLGLGLAACDGSGKDMVALYGVEVTDDTGAVDADGDGWTVAAGDCNDADIAIHPEAEETAGDGVDSNCNDQDDT